MIRPVDIVDFNNKLINQIYKEVDKMVEGVDSENMDELLLLQEKLGSLLLVLRKENEWNLKD